MVTTISAGLIIAILVSLLKPFLEARISQANSLHDGTIRLVAVLIGVIGEVAHTAVTGQLTAQSAWNAAGSGLLDAVTAIAAFHLVTGNYFSLAGSVTQLAPSTIAPAAPAPAEPAPAAAPIFPPAV